MNLIKFSPPTHHDKEPQGTICYIMVSEDYQIKYVQTSADQENPVWKAQDISHDVWATEVDYDY